MRDTSRHTGSGRRFFGLLVRTVVFTLVVWIQGPVCVAQGEDEQSPRERGRLGIFQDLKLSGGIWLGYRFRSDEQDEDQDVHSYMNLRFRDIVKDRLDADLSFRINKDIDGGRNRKSLFYDSFRDLDDARDLEYPDELYTANVEIHDLLRPDSDVRVGRQYLTTFHGLHIDGIWLNSKKHGPFDFEAFVGRPVSFYSGVHGDKALGGAVTYRHSRSTRGRVAYYRYDDSRQEDDYIDLDLWHRLFDNLFIHTSLDFLEEDLQRFVLTNHYYHEPIDLDLWLIYTHLFSPIGEHTIEFSPLYATLNELDPYDRVDLRVSKSLTSRWLLYGGVSLRSVDDETKGHDRANRDYELYDLGITYSPVTQLSFSVTGEYWDLDSGDRFSGVTSEVEYRPNKEWRFVLGNSYAKYRDIFYDLFNLQTVRRTPDVLTYYGRVQWKATENTSLSAKLTAEDDDSDQSPFYTVELSMGLFF